ncbi:MAG: right-handed parallel beta-helix repeat-containing protein [Coleofasciculus sp. C1-SOL-03]|uniref:right-handed parallel beta-helix repeat-containing protein n=1 Tax=Coleofasciculus sp. C1-SOL-03 TaxID=3069522 RepID=UPI003303D270
MYTRTKAIASIGLWASGFSLLMESASAQTAAIVVNTTVDDINAGDGNCTLREAINNANTNRDTTNGDCRTGSPYPTIDAIAFNIQSAQPSIIPNSPLPTITEAVVIDGTSQPGFKTTATHSLTCPNPMGVPLPAQTITISRPIIELNGAAAGKVSGITIDADQVVIRGLVINQFQRAGIEILNNSSQVIIDSNYIGTDITGTVALGNNRGVVIKAGNTTNPNNITIKNNVISGNTFLGVLVNGDANADQQGNTIVNNFIGTDYTGKKVLGNTTEKRGHGVVIGHGNFAALDSRYPAQNHRIRGNVIAGSHTTNLWVSNYASNNLVECNYIGTDYTGTVALGNCIDGLLIGGTRSDAPSRLNKIRHNLISGNARCQGNSEANLTLQWGAIENTIENNLIGTDITGIVALSPILSTDGIGIKKPANQIRNNVIGGNRRHGIHIYRGFGTQPWDNRIENNYIGINPSGITIANGGDGIAIFSNIYTPDSVLPLMDVLIRGTRITGNAIANNNHNGIRLEARGDEVGFNASITNTQISNNTIHDNGANGIQITTVETVSGGIAEAINNLIQTNRLFNNQGLGISLSSSRSTSHDAFLNGETGNHLSASVPIENDVLDLDSGSNQLQNYPTLLSAEGKNNHTEIQGILISTPNTQFTLEFFANRSADPSDYGEGEVPLGSLSVTTDNRGEAVFSAILPATVMGQVITATATDSSGNTSEFSRHIQVKFK